MKKVKVLRDKQASQTKHALDIGDVAPIVLENFETLTQPPFKPRLELIEADPHDPPDMNTQTDQNITTDGEDQKRPDQGDLAGSSDYENSPGAEKEQVPHEHEHVKQGAVKTAEEDDDSKENEEEDTSDDNPNSVEAIQKLKTEYASRYTLATKLFDIRKAAGIEEEINRYNFANTTAESFGVPELEAKVAEGEAYLKQIHARVSQTEETETPETKVAGVRIPGGFNGGHTAHESPFEDDLQMVVMGGALTQ